MTQDASDNTDNGSTSKRVAREIRKMVFNLEDGAFVGSEQDLIAQLRVSRPTFRQAAKLVEQENLLTIKRGVGGGYFARKPDSIGVAHMTGLFLQSRDASMEDAIEASLWLYEHAAVLASQRRNDDSAKAFREFLEREEEAPKDGKEGYLAFLRSEQNFGKIFSAASGNPLLELNILILYNFAGSLEKSLFRANLVEREQYRQYRNKIASAIVEHDEELASIFARRMCDFTLDLLKRRHRDGEMPLIVVS